MDDLIALPSDRQPIVMGMTLADGLFIKEYKMEDAGLVVPQHSHAYSHVSGIVAGAVALHKDGEFIGEFYAPARVTIEAHAKHLFVTLAPNTVIWCIHAVGAADEPEIHEEHQIVETV